MHTRYKTFIDMAQICFDHKDYLRAIKYSGKALDYTSIGPDAHYILGMSHYYLGNYITSKDELDSFLMFTRHNETDTRIFDANYILAHCYYNLKEFKQSIASFNTCIYRFKFSVSNNNYILKQKTSKENVIKIKKERGSKLLSDSGLSNILTVNDDTQLWETILEYYDFSSLEEHAFIGKNLSFILLSSINDSSGEDKIVTDEWYFEKINDFQFKPIKTTTDFDINNYSSISIQRPSINIKTVSVSFSSVRNGSVKSLKSSDWFQDKDGLWQESENSGNILLID